MYMSTWGNFPSKLGLRYTYKESISEEICGSNENLFAMGSFFRVIGLSFHDVESEKQQKWHNHTTELISILSLVYN